MRKLYRGAAVVVVATAATIIGPGAVAPAGAHEISCHLAEDLSNFGSWVSCQVGTQVHKAEHAVGIGG